MPVDVFGEILKLPKYGDGIGLRRTYEAMPEVWQSLSTTCEIIHVVGTNGKGSTALFLEKMLETLGVSTGTFLSPHYFEFSERFRLNGTQVSANALGDAWQSLHSLPTDFSSFGSFEIMTLLSVLVFERERPDVLIIEAGIGGRYDPTRLFAGRHAVLTSIDLEHTQLLGNTRAEIVADKIDVLGPDGTIVSGWLGDDLAGFFSFYAGLGARQSCYLDHELIIDRHGFKESGKAGVVVEGIDGLASKLDFAVPASYFVKNSLLGYQLLKTFLLQSDARARLDETFVSTCAEFTLPVRFEVISRDPYIVCDGAHTPDAVREVARSYRHLHSEQPTMILGVSADKNWREISRILTEFASDFLVFAAHHKGQAPEEIANVIRTENPAACVQCFDSSVQLWRWLRENEKGSGKSFLATGGLFSALEFRTAVSGGDVSSLTFY